MKALNSYKKVSSPRVTIPQVRMILFCIFAAIHATAAYGQPERPVRNISIEELTVTARRALTDIGTQKTKPDSMAMRDNITKSMADVLSQSSSIFIKSYGRGTLSTASFRGTAPSHTQVTWNDMKVNSPMLGMVDFSLIPSYFIDEVTLYHGASSVGITGGGFGGAITLESKPVADRGFAMRYIQGIGSFNTYDQFLSLGYGNERFQSSTRAFYGTSKNDFPYTNYRKKNYIYDNDGQIVDWYYPTEKNKNGSFKDLHLQQEFYYKTASEDNISLSGWYTDSRRGVPMLNVDYKEESRSSNRQDEKTFRAVTAWTRVRENFKLYARAGYTYTDLQYVYLGDVGKGKLVEMIHSRSYVHTAYGKLGGDYYMGDKWLFSGNIALHQHFVNSMDRSVVSSDGRKTTIGYNQARAELSGFASVRYRPTERLGIAANIREELYGDKWSPVIPAGFIEYMVSRKGNVVAKASVARNYRYPTLNDLYFMPGGNPDLLPERGFTYDAGLEFRIDRKGMELKGEATFYDSYITDWILWLPTFKGFWSPVNVKEVHSYGIELKAKFRADLGRNWWLYLDANYTVSKAINRGDPASWGDGSINKQLVYIPENSDAITGKLGWKSWVFTYKFNYYSERFTTSSNETKTKIGRISPYYMSDISLEKAFSTKWCGLTLKLSVNNIFDEEYESVLSRPMAGRNYGFFIEIVPKFSRGR